MTHATFGQPAQVGDKVGSYELTEKLEESAALITFRGRDPLLDRRVIVRQALANAADDAARQLLRERIDRYRNLARHHKRVVNVIETIDDPRGLFVVHEQADGDTLDVRLAHGKPISPMSVLRITRSVALALEPMHQQGMVHRDLRPGCLIITKAGTVRIGDFGFAGMVADTDTLGVASVRYMAPELCRGEAGDARSDLYALGMIAYEMLVGRSAFDDVFSAVLRDTRQQAVRWVKWHTNPRNVAPPADEVNPGVPPMLAQIVARLMEKDPARRIASTRELLDAIQRHFSREAAAPEETIQPAPQTESETAAPPTVTASTGGDTVALPPPPCRPWAIIAAVVALLALAGGYFVYQTVATNRVAAAALAHDEQSLRDAEAAYKRGDFDAAQVLYDRVAQSSASPRLAQIARAGVQRCDAHLAMAAGDFAAAREAIAKVEAAGVFNRDAIRELAEEVESRGATQQALTDIRAQVAAGDFDAAHKALSDWRGAVVSDADRQQIESLYGELQAGEANRRVDRALADAEGLVKAGQIDDAIVELSEQNEALRSPKLQDRLDTLTAQRKATQLLTQGESAAAADDWAGAIVAYSEAARYSNEPAIAQKLADAKMRAALAEGRRLYDSGDLDRAAAAFTRALGYGESTEARGYLARMEASGQSRALLRAGDEAMAAGEFEAAARHYREALNLDATNTALAAKLDEARLRQFIADGRRLLEHGDYPEAQAAFAQAQDINPDAPGVAEGLAQLEKLVPYKAELDRGDRLLANGEYTAAKRAYAAARQILDTPQVRARADDAEYEHLIAQARSYMAVTRWEPAAALLASAAKIHDTPVVRELMRKTAAKERE